MIDRKTFLNKCCDKKEKGLKDTGVLDFATEFKAFFPKFPMQVIEQWPYRHFDSFVNSDRWEIEYDRLAFQKEYLSIEDFKVIEARDMSNKDLLRTGQVHLADTDFVACYMRKHYTYPVPIIVLDSVHSDLSGAYCFKTPYHLLEGHRRTWLLRALIETKNLVIPQKHEVWMVTRK